MNDLDRLEDFIKAIARETQWNTGQALISLQRLRQQMEQQDERERQSSELISRLEGAAECWAEVDERRFSTNLRHLDELAAERKKVEQQEGEIAKLKVAVTSGRERWTKALNREFELKGLITEAKRALIEITEFSSGWRHGQEGMCLLRIDTLVRAIHTRLASVGTQGEATAEAGAAPAGEALRELQRRAGGKP